MAELFHFSPKAELDARNNLKDFIDFCRYKLTVFGEDLDWQSNRWYKVTNFTKVGVKTNGWGVEDVLDRGILDFSKAYIRYQQGHKPTKTKNENKAFRCVEKAFLSEMKSVDLVKFDVPIADKAAQVARENYSAMAAYHAGREIERMISFVSENHLIQSPFSWVSPLKKPEDENIRIGKKADDRRNEKIPDEGAVFALAEIFNQYPDLSPLDIFTTSVFALLMCGPERISEVLSLPADCLVYDKDSKGNSCVGIRQFSAKGFGGTVKWIPSVMVPIAEEAVRRILELTKEARKLALWYENNESGFYMHSACVNHPSKAPLSVEEVALAVGFSPDQSPSTLKTNLKKAKYLNQSGEATYEQLDEVVRKQVPKDFPIFDKKTGLKWSEALFCMRKDEISDSRPIMPVRLFRPSQNTINHNLGPRAGVKNHESIFVRHGYPANYKVTSHQPRHQLNTEAMKSGMGDVALAKWSGRADPKQNRHYNHIKQEEMVSLAEKASQSMALVDVTEQPINTPVSINEFELMESGIAQTTEFGYCLHDYALSPCSKHRDCLNCSEQVCVKGDEERLKRLEKRLEIESGMFEKIKESIAKGERGTDRWYDTKKRTVERLTELIAIMNDDSIPDDSLIRLKPEHEHNALERELSAQGLSLKDLGSIPFLGES